MLAVVNKSQGSPITTKVDALPPAFPPSTQPQPFIPLIAPSPLRPFTNNSVPKLSGMVFFFFPFKSVSETLHYDSFVCSVLVYTISAYPLAYCSCWLLKVRGLSYKGRNWDKGE